MQAVIIFLPDLFPFWLTASMNHSLEHFSQPYELEDYFESCKRYNYKMLKLMYNSITCNYTRISHNLIFPCSLAIAKRELEGLNATALTLPNGVCPVGQFL